MLAALFLIATNQITSPPEYLKLDPFYKKHISANGFPIVSSNKVPNKALVEAKRVVNAMLSQVPKAKDQMIKNNVRLTVMGKNEFTTQIPEHAFLKDDKKTNWDERARGLGATLHVPVVSCAEENVLAYPDDRYKGESILVHEFAHAIMDTGLVQTDPTFKPTIQKLYDQAKKEGLWENTYAMTNIHEFWAEAVQSYLDCNRSSIPTDGVHNHVATRPALKKYHPELHDFVAKYMPKDWKYVPPHPAWKDGK